MIKKKKKMPYKLIPLSELRKASVKRRWNRVAKDALAREKGTDGTKKTGEEEIFITFGFFLKRTNMLPWHPC